MSGVTDKLWRLNVHGAVGQHLFGSHFFRGRLPSVGVGRRRIVGDVFEQHAQLFRFHRSGLGWIADGATSDVARADESLPDHGNQLFIASAFRDVSLRFDAQFLSPASFISLYLVIGSGALEPTGSFEPNAPAFAVVYQSLAARLRTVGWGADDNGVAANFYQSSVEVRRAARC